MADKNNIQKSDSVFIDSQTPVTLYLIKDEPTIIIEFPDTFLKTSQGESQAFDIAESMETKLSQNDIETLLSRRGSRFTISLPGDSSYKEIKDIGEKIYDSAKKLLVEIQQKSQENESLEGALDEVLTGKHEPMTRLRKTPKTQEITSRMKLRGKILDAITPLDDPALQNGKFSLADNIITQINMLSSNDKDINSEGKTREETKKALQKGVAAVLELVEGVKLDDAKRNGLIDALTDIGLAEISRRYNEKHSQGRGR